MTFCGRGLVPTRTVHLAQDGPLLARTRFPLDAKGRRHRHPARLGALADIEERRGAAG